jgi:hypothetical protein
MCGASLAKGTMAHYLPATKTVRCAGCFQPRRAQTEVDTGAGVVQPPVVESTAPQLVQAPLPRPARCDDCGRSLRTGAEAVSANGGPPVLCMECVALDTVHTLGVAGTGARREHAARTTRHQTRVRTKHPRLGGLILALNDDPAHVRAWQTGAVGEESFGRALSGIASEGLKVLHDRKIPRSTANIDHIAVTSETVWVLDSKRYKGRVEARTSGLFSRRPPDLFVGGRNRTNLIAGVHRQVEIVRGLVTASRPAQNVDVPVRGGLVFVDAEFGLLPKPLVIDGIWVGWGKAIRRRLTEETGGELPAADLAKHLARDLRPGG